MLPILPQRLAALLIISICTSFLLQGQVTYQGLLEGIYPVRLVLDKSTPNAALQISTLENQIKFIGGCSADKCKYRGIDTSLAIVFDKLQNQP